MNRNVLYGQSKWIASARKLFLIYNSVFRDFTSSLVMDHTLFVKFAKIRHGNGV